MLQQNAVSQNWNLQKQDYVQLSAGDCREKLIKISCEPDIKIDYDKVMDIFAS